MSRHCIDIEFSERETLDGDVEAKTYHVRSASGADPTGFFAPGREQDVGFLFGTLGCWFIVATVSAIVFTAFSFFTAYNYTYICVLFYVVAAICGFLVFILPDYKSGFYFGAMIGWIGICISVFIGTMMYILGPVVASVHRRSNENFETGFVQWLIMGIVIVLTLILDLLYMATAVRLYRGS